MSTVRAERGFRKSLYGSGLCHGPRIAGADPGLRAVDGSDPALWDACCGIGAVWHVQAHAALPAGSLPYQRSLRYPSANGITCCISISYR